MHYLRQIIGSTEAPYVAIHLRMGGFDGEWKSIVRFDQFRVSGLLKKSCYYDPRSNIF